MRDHCGPKRSAAPNRTKITLQVFDDVTLDKEVDVVLVSGDDVTVTLPFQPLAGTTVLVATVSTGTVVEPGCPDDCSCDDGCDTFCSSTEAVPVTQALIPPFSQQLFTYFPGDSCDCGPGCWVFGIATTATDALPIPG